MERNVKIRNNKGITLVALVVTIVVLLILAGVSINLILGKNGLIKRAQESANSTRNAQKNEVALMENWRTEISGLVGAKAKDITKDDYGKTVTNYTAGDQTWEIFYADNENVYLITRNAAKTGNLSIAVEENSGYNGTSDFTGDDNFKTKYPSIVAGWLNKTYEPSTNTVLYSSSYDNMKCTEYLLDSSVWNTTYKNDIYVDWAIGSPTLEMLVASYGKYINTTVTIADSSGTGYDATITSGLTNGTVYNYGYHYWLACPSKYYDYDVRLVTYDSESVGGNAYDISRGLRPVVCLKSSVMLVPSEDGSSYTISE